MIKSLYNMDTTYDKTASGFPIIPHDHIWDIALTRPFENVHKGHTPAMCAMILAEEVPDSSFEYYRLVQDILDHFGHEAVGWMSNSGNTLLYLVLDTIRKHTSLKHLRILVPMVHTIIRLIDAPNEIVVSNSKDNLNVFHLITIVMNKLKYVHKNDSFCYIWMGFAIDILMKAKRYGWKMKDFKYDHPCVVNDNECVTMDQLILPEIYELIQKYDLL